MRRNYNIGEEIVSNVTFPPNPQFKGKAFKKYNLLKKILIQIEALFLPEI